MGKAPGSGGPTRQRILALALQEPGITRTGIQEQTGLAWGTIGHHLRVLLQEARIDIVRVGRTLHVLPAAYMQRHGPALAVPLARRILHALTQGPAGPTRISREAGASPRRVQGQLQLLEAAGLIATDDGYHPQYELTPQGLGAAADLESPGVAIFRK